MRAHAHSASCCWVRRSSIREMACAASSLPEPNELCRHQPHGVPCEGDANGFPTKQGSPVSAPPATAASSKRVSARTVSRLIVRFLVIWRSDLFIRERYRVAARDRYCAGAAESSTSPCASGTVHRETSPPFPLVTRSPPSKWMPIRTCHLEANHRFVAWPWHPAQGRCLQPPSPLSGLRCYRRESLRVACCRAFGAFRVSARVWRWRWFSSSQDYTVGLQPCRIISACVGSRVTRRSMASGQIVKYRCRDRLTRRPAGNVPGDAARHDLVALKMDPDHIGAVHWQCPELASRGGVPTAQRAIDASGHDHGAIG